MKPISMKPIKRLFIVLGDQLSMEPLVLQNFDKTHDLVWMAEVTEESTHVASTKPRTVMFLSAMRHFAQELTNQGYPLHYTQLDDADNSGTLAAELCKAIVKYQPAQLLMTAPGDWRVLKNIQATAKAASLPLQILDDPHFYTTVRDFAAHAKGRKQLRMEFWYRELRKRFDVLMEGDAKNRQPVGGQWNFDADNRASFGKAGPQHVPDPAQFEPDEITQAVINLVNLRFAKHAGKLDAFAWPVTQSQAQQALQRFIAERLPHFGQYEDAMWTNEPWLYHSHLSAALNLKLLNPREVVCAAENAYARGAAPLAAVEGFIRQILGWREYVRGIYWMHMPQYLELNALNANEQLPSFFWSGQTDMACLNQCITQTLDLGYAHHIQRLMVIGLYTLLFGVDPKHVHEWYLSVYVDAVEWVELPNTLGMSQFGDGGIMASKPYVASGKYIDKMSNYCKGCRYDPAESTGEKACPYTTLYWDFLIKHHERLEKNPRMGMQLKNLARLSDEKKEAIQTQALKHKKNVQKKGLTGKG
jgi:deoxyribodipyrimidine photolyase-related protein